MSVLPLICENQIPDRYYKVINRISPTISDIYVFVGVVPENINSILELIQKGNKLVSGQNNQLLKYFGINYKRILATEGYNNSNVSYIRDLIEIDDNISAIKNKIAAYLRILIDWQYLYVYINGGGNQGAISLGHTFIERKESKKSEDILIEYPKDPFENVDLSHSSMNYFVDANTGIKLANYQRNDTGSYLITEYNIIKDEIYLVTFCNFVNFSQKFKFTGTTNLNKFKNGYLAKYWPVLVHENEVKTNQLYDICSGKTVNMSEQLDQLISKVDQKDLMDKVERDSYIISLIKNPPEAIVNADIKFENCGILEIVLHINYNQEENEFVDLMKIFDRYHLNQMVPFVKYKGEKSKEPRHKLYTPIIDENPIEIVQDWISNIQKRKKDDVFEYRVSGKGLSFKKLLYQNKDPKTNALENKYATINFYKDGKIELKCFWEEYRNATLSDVREALIGLVILVNEINEIEYHLPGIDRTKRIKLPELNFIDDKESNTQIAFVNTVTRFDYGDLINFDKINNFASCFNTFVSIIKKNISLEYDASLGKNIFKTVMSNSLQLRYKRINNYLQMTIVEKFIHDIIKQTEGIDKIFIVKLLAERFNIVQERAEKIYMAYDATQGPQKDEEKYTNIDYVLGKKIRKQPGIDIKIQGQESDKYKIFVLGAKSIFQLSLIHQFLKSLLRLFKRIDVISSDPIFISHAKKGLCQSPETLIDEGINESMDAYKKIEKQKKVTKITTDLVEDIEEGDIDDIMALLEADDLGPTEEDIDDELKAAEVIDDDAIDDSDPDEEGEIDQQKDDKIVKKQAKFDYTKGVQALARLKDADVDLFKGAKYATTCQANAFKQPMVIDADLQEEKRSELEKRLTEIKERELHLGQTKPMDYLKQMQELTKERTRLNYKLDVYKKGVEYRKNYYFCPAAYEYSTERILHPEEIDQATGKDLTTGNPVYLVKKKNVNLPYAGFAAKSTHPDGKLCMPCCYGKQHTRFDECLTTGVMEPKMDIKSNLRYVLAAEKTGIPVGRFGMLPDTLNLIFNNGVKSENKIMAGFDSYLRKGISTDPPHNIFLNALGNALPTSVDGATVRKTLINKLSQNIFLILKSGALKLVFTDNSDNSDQTAYENFKKFIDGNSLIDEDLMWDYITMPGILTSKGFNLFIFESQGLKGKITEQIVLKCPSGYDINDLYNTGRPSLVLFKYSNRYEPIYKITDNGTIIKTIEMFSPEHLIIKKLISMSDQCSPEIDFQAYNNEELLLKKINQMPLKFEEPYTIRKTIDRMNQMMSQTQKIIKTSDYKILGQIIDDYNKATYVVLTNNFKIPVKPSSRSQHLPIINYNEIPPLSYGQTLDIIKQILDYTTIPIRPLMTITDGSGQNVLGILLNNGFAIEVETTAINNVKSIGLLKQINIPTMRQYYHSRYAVDQSIAKMDELNQVDERLHYVNLRKFEDESYQRLRYELSKELRKKQYSQLIEQLEKVIHNNALSVNERRHQLSNLLIDPIQKIIVTKRQQPYNYDQYLIPNVRTQCQTKNEEMCFNDPHCELNDLNECNLFIEPVNLVDQKKTNINRYLSLIIEELLKNHLKREEMLDDQVDNTVDENIFEYRGDEMIFRDSTYKENKRRLERLYKTDIDYYERLSRLYDTVNPAYYQDSSQFPSLMLSKLTESSCNQGLEPLTVYWGQIVGANFRRLTNDKSTNCIYYALSLAFNQRDNNKGINHTIQSIRNFAAENIVNLKDDIGTTKRKGWEMLLDHYRFLFKDKIGDIHTFTELKDYMKSDTHQVSLIDLILISQLYNVKFIIMSRQRSPFNPSGFICLGSTTSVNDDYILLYKVDWEDYQIVGNANYSPPKYIFAKEELPTKLYQHWAEVCGKTDLKNDIDEQIPLLFKAPLFKSLNISPIQPTTGKVKINFKPISSKTYFVDPNNQEILSQQTSKKIPLKPKIIPHVSEQKTDTQQIKDQIIEANKQGKIQLKFKPK